MAGWMTYMFQLINLGIILWLFRRYFYPQVKAFWQERKESIAGEFDQARGARQEAEDLAVRRRIEMEEARNTINRFKSQSELESREQARRLEMEARHKAALLAKEAEREARLAEKRGLEQATPLVIKLAADMAAQALQAVADDEMHRRIMERALQELVREAGAHDGQ